MAAEHQKPIESGFHAKSELVDILAGIDLSGKTAIVTGGYSGIGLETARALAAAGAHVHVPARDLARARETLADILPAEQVSEMDLSDLKSVSALPAILLTPMTASTFLLPMPALWHVPNSAQHKDGNGNSG